eukprot:m.640105 g.640105  ORF g.640105 m.640105 type:complete len:78 (+) comp58337_c0_seq6:1644-1877(+)
MAVARRNHDVAHLLQTHEEYLANLGAHTKPAVRTNHEETSLLQSPTEDSTEVIDLLHHQPEQLRDTEADGELVFINR